MSLFCSRKFKKNYTNTILCAVVSSGCLLTSSNICVSAENLDILFVQAALNAFENDETKNIQYSPEMIKLVEFLKKHSQDWCANDPLAFKIRIVDLKKILCKDSTAKIERFCNQDIYNAQYRYVYVNFSSLFDYESKLSIYEDKQLKHPFAASIFVRKKLANNIKNYITLVNVVLKKISKQMKLDFRVKFSKKEDGIYIFVLDKDDYELTSSTLDKATTAGKLRGMYKYLMRYDTSDEKNVDSIAETSKPRNYLRRIYVNDTENDTDQKDFVESTEGIISDYDRDLAYCFAFPLGSCLDLGKEYFFCLKNSKLTKNDSLSSKNGELTTKDLQLNEFVFNRPCDRNSVYKGFFEYMRLFPNGDGYFYGIDKRGFYCSATGNKISNQYKLKFKFTPIDNKFARIAFYYNQTEKEPYVVYTVKLEERKGKDRNENEITVPCLKIVCVEAVPDGSCIKCGDFDKNHVFFPPISIDVRTSNYNLFAANRSNPFDASWDTDNKNLLVNCYCKASLTEEKSSEENLVVNTNPSEKDLVELKKAILKKDIEQCRLSLKKCTCNNMVVNVKKHLEELEKKLIELEKEKEKEKRKNEVFSEKDLTDSSSTDLSKVFLITLTDNRISMSDVLHNDMIFNRLCENGSKILFEYIKFLPKGEGFFYGINKKSLQDTENSGSQLKKYKLKFKWEVTGDTDPKTSFKKVKISFYQEGNNSNPYAVYFANLGGKQRLIKKCDMEVLVPSLEIVSVELNGKTYEKNEDCNIFFPPVFDDVRISNSNAFFASRSIDLSNWNKKGNENVLMSCYNENA